MDYRIEEYDSSKQLETNVNELIADGWRPVGGVSLMGDAIYVLYAQALVKEK